MRYFRSHEELENFRDKVESEINNKVNACKSLLDLYKNVPTYDDGFHASLNREKMKRIRLSISELLMEIEKFSKELKL